MWFYNPHIKRSQNEPKINVTHCFFMKKQSHLVFLCVHKTALILKMKSSLFSQHRNGLATINCKVNLNPCILSFAQWDCGSDYEIHVELLNQRKKPIRTFCPRDHLLLAVVWSVMESGTYDAPVTCWGGTKAKDNTCLLNMHFSEDPCFVTAQE